MLAYYVEWHMRRVFAPMLFDDHDPDVVARAQAAPAKQAKVNVVVEQGRSAGRSPALIATGSSPILISS